MSKKRNLIEYTPLLVLLLSVVLSVELYLYTNEAIKKEVRSSFDSTAADMAGALKNRMQAYEQVLASGRSFIEAENYSISREKWLTYARGLQLEVRYPGVQGLSFVSYVPYAEAEHHQIAIRAQGDQQYTVHPLSVKDYVTPIDYIYPESIQNLRAIGFDVSSEQNRNSMIEYVMTTGKAGLTGRIKLKQDIGNNSTPGILMGLPVYRDDNIYGFVTAPFRMVDLMHGIFEHYDKGLAVTIYDNSDRPNNQLYSSNRNNTNDMGYVKTVRIPMYGREWLMVFRAQDGFLSKFDFDKPLILLLAGLITGTLLAILAFIILQTRARAYEIAEHMTQKLYESENRYKKTYEQAPVGIMMTSLDLKLFRANKKICSITGYSMKELTRMPFAALMSEKDFLDIIRAVEKLISKQTDMYESERKLITGSSVEIWTDITVSAYFDKNGNPLYLIFVVEDITRRKKAEEGIIALSIRQAAILDNSLVGIMQTRNRMIEWVNSAVETLSGYSADDLIGKTTRVLFCSDSDYDDFGRKIADGRDINEKGYISTNRQMLKKDGRMAWLEIVGKKISSTPDSPAIWVLSDITDRITAENELMLLNSTLETKVVEETQKRIEQERMFMQQARLAAMGEMIGAIAHQWRQPLNVIAIMVQNVYDDFEQQTLTKEGMDEFLEQTVKQVDYMSETIDDFRNFFRNDVDVERFDPEEQIRSVLKIVGTQLMNSRISVTFEKKSDAGITGSPNEFSHVVLNIINNAKDACVQNNINEPGIRITMECENDNVVIAVADNAGGVPAEIKDKVFDPYFTTKGPDKGTGLGLYMSKLIIDDHFSGSLSCHNADGGAVFVIKIPQSVKKS